MHRAIFRTTILVLFIVLIPCQSWAAFTAPEQAQLQRLYGAEYYTQAAFSTAANGVRGGVWNTYMRAGLASLASAMTDIDNGIAGLLNVVGTDAFVDPTGVPRDQTMAAVYVKLDHAAWLLTQADAYLAASGSADAQVARTVWLSTALWHLVNFDRSLGYLSPNPAPYPRIIGPHGRFDQMEFQLWRSNVYMSEMLTSVISELPSHLTDREAAWRVMDSAAILLMRQTHQMLRLAFPAAVEDTAFSDFFRILAVVKVLTTELPELFHAIQSSLVFLDLSAFISVRLTDSWRHMDFGVWEALIFPDCTHEQHVQGCGGGL